MKRVWIFFAVVSTLFADVRLQQVIDRAAPGAKIELPSGTFAGPIRIDKPLILIGSGKKSIIAGTGRGSVVTIAASYVTIENLTITGSGTRRDALDAAVRIERVRDVTIRNCRIDHALFGIVAQESDDLRFTDNRIASYDEKVVDNRGDGIRLWNCRRALIAGNRLTQSRDLSVNRSADINISHNRIARSRYGILLNISHHVSAANNRIESNYAGIVCKGGSHLTIENNAIIKTRLATGIGILLAHGKRVYVTHNILTGCAQAFYIDSSPVEIGMRRTVTYNRIVNNDTAFHFHAAIKNNTIRHNDIIGNLDDVVKDIRSAHPYNPDDNDIAYNYWDRYRGFDRNGDGIGDTPYLVLIYADKLWQFNHHLKFFYATPLLTLLDFLERLAPFSEPILLLEDPLPNMAPNLR